MKERIRAALTGGLGPVQGRLALGITALAVALVVVFNLILGELPTNVAQIDLSDQGLYTISQESRDYLAGLEQDVELIFLVEPDSLDPRIEKFADSYAALSSHLTVRQVDPVANPSILDTYDASANTLVVNCPDTGKYETVSLYGLSDSIITYDSSYYYYYQQQVENSFDADGLITSAVDYVVKDTSRAIYTLEGHGEGDLGDNLVQLIEKSNLALSSVNLLTDGGVPQGCDALIINDPQQDLSDDELEMLRSYLTGGGKVMVLLDDAALTNFNALLQEYGLELQDGYVADTQRFYQNYYYIFPQVEQTDTITADLPGNATILLPYSFGMQQCAAARDGITVTPLLTTSSQSYLVTEESQSQAQSLIVAAVAREETGEEDEGAEGTLVVFSCPSLIDPTFTTANASLENLSLFMDALTDSFTEVSDLDIPAKSLSVTYNTIPSAGMWGVLAIGVIPLAVLGLGAYTAIKRRRT